MLGTKRRATVVGLASLALAVPAVLVAPAVTAQPSYATSDELQQDVRLNRILRHLDRFQRFAEESNNTRASGTPGYDASARYVYTELQKAGYNVVFQEFPFTYTEEVTEVLREVSPTPRDLPVDVMTYSPAGTVEADVAVVPVDADTGCTPEDFATQDYTGKVALIQRGGCTFAVKSSNAAAAGAVAAIIQNNDTVNPDLLANGTLGAPGATPIPTAGTSYNVGQLLADEVAAGQTVRVFLDLEEFTEERSTRNVIAETPGGDKSNVVMQGAHLDSVPEGPGINDNGSGSAALLEVALQAIKYEQNQALRFAWWGAEEFGLVGSNYYVANLPDEELVNIAVYLNYDMVGSPNFVRFVYDGDGSAFGLVGPPGSAQIEQTYADYFASEALYSDPTAFSGRSDYQAFINNGIPAGGLFTGAEGIKTEEEAARYGGTAGIAYDPCYHQACDNRGNVNTTVLDQNADAIAHITATYAFSIQTILDAKAAAAGDGGAGAARTAEAVTAEDLAAAA